MSAFLLHHPPSSHPSTSPAQRAPRGTSRASIIFGSVCAALIGLAAAVAVSGGLGFPAGTDLPTPYPAPAPVAPTGP